MKNKIKRILSNEGLWFAVLMGYLPGILFAWGTYLGWGEVRYDTSLFGCFMSAMLMTIAILITVIAVKD